MPSPSVIAHRQRRRTNNLSEHRRQAHFALLLMIFIDITASVVTTTTYPIPKKSRFAPEYWHAMKYFLVAQKTLLILTNFLIAAMIATLRLEFVNCGKTGVQTVMFVRLIQMPFESGLWTAALLGIGVSMLNTFLAFFSIILYNMFCIALAKYQLEESLYEIGKWIRERREVSVSNSTVPEKQYELEPVYGTC